MAINLGFGAAVSGLNVSAKSLEVTGNNIANSNTVGFKSSRAHFGDVLAHSISAGLATQKVGMGASAQAVEQQFRQGTLRTTENPLDVAINGRGFFVLGDGEDITYTRNGQFHLEGVPGVAASETSPLTLVNTQGLSVLGYPADYAADPLGTINSAGDPTSLVLEKTMPSTATTQVEFAANLAASAEILSGVSFDPELPASYHHVDAFSAVGADGNEVQVGLYFRKVEAGQWEVYLVEDDVAQATPLSLGFDARGNMTAGQSQTVTLSSGQTIGLDFNGTTQYGNVFSVDKKAQNGFLEGVLTSVAVDRNGVLVGSFNNGESRKLAQLALADFVNPNGLTSIGDNQWEETEASGQPVRGVARDINGFGAINGSMVEDASIDMNQELVDLIIQQRNYQANAQAIKTQDQILQTLAGIR